MEEISLEHDGSDEGKPTQPPIFVHGHDLKPAPDRLEQAFGFYFIAINFNLI